MREICTSGSTRGEGVARSSGRPLSYSTGFWAVPIPRTGEFEVHKLCATCLQENAFAVQYNPIERRMVS